jgi:outer membrane protein X
MKNVRPLFTAMLLAVCMSVSAQFTNSSSSASKGYGGGTSSQKGQVAIGANLSYSPCLESGFKVNNIGLSAKLQYGLSDALRGELLLGYELKDKEIGMFHVSANLHYLFNVTEKLKIYPIVGVGYGRLNAGFWDDMADAFNDAWKDYPYYFDDEDYDDDSGSRDRVLVNAGIGTEYAITDQISASLEVKYQYIKDFNRLPIALGVIYKF